MCWCCLAEKFCWVLISCVFYEEIECAFIVKVYDHLTVFLAFVSQEVLPQ